MEHETMKCYKYYLLHRPPMPGAFPNEKDNQPLEIVDFGKKRKTDDNTIIPEAWGYVVYEKPLSVTEILEYELEGIILEK